LLDGENRGHAASIAASWREGGRAKCRGLSARAFVTRDVAMHHESQRKFSSIKGACRSLRCAFPFDPVAIEDLRRETQPLLIS